MRVCMCLCYVCVLGRHACVSYAAEVYHIGLD